jgi:PAS domain S-box-containing protein
MTAEAATRAPAGEDGFHLLGEHLPDLVLVAFDLELRIWAATGAALRARGWTAGNFVGKRVPEVGRPADAAVTEAYCLAALDGECRRLETNGSKDPSRLWAQLFVPLPDGRGTVIGGMVIARDVTEQRRAERQLLASRRQLAEAQRIAQVGSWEWDLVSDEASMSDEMIRILGLPPGSGRGMQEIVARFVHPADLDRVMAHVGRLPTDPSPFTLEHRNVRGDGTVRSLLVRGEGVVDELLWQVTKDLSTEVTSLRRTIGRLRPLVLVEDGLEAALREEAKSACNRAALVSCEVTSELDGRLDPVVETALFRVAQQALANVVDHAGATRALVAIECVPSGVVLRVSDDGRGFDPDHVQVLADIAHFGLIAMRERVEALGGRFRVTTAPGKGTVVEAKLPLTVPTEGSGP